MNLTSYFDTTYKRAASRVNLLRSIRPSVDQKCAETIYITMILLTFTCCVTCSWLVRHPKKSHVEHWTKKFNNHWKQGSEKFHQSKLRAKAGNWSSNVFKIMFSPPLSRILRDSIILVTRNNGFQVKSNLG